METNTNAQEAWYETWFDSPYYHLLYKHRDDIEAAIFLQNLSQKLHFKPDDHFLDLACGKGRHSITLHQMGYQVTGADLSKNSILYAKQFEKPGLKFLVKDMREVVIPQGFSHVLSLFTSFGYFETDEENQKVMQAVWQNLKNQGLFIIDYLNAEKAIKNLPGEEFKTIADIHFTIYKSVVGDRIIKNITVEDTGFKFQYMESVKIYRLNDFMKMLAFSGFSVKHVWGDYALTPYDETNSDRLIICAQKEISA